MKYRLPGNHVEGEQENGPNAQAQTHQGPESGGSMVTRQALILFAVGVSEQVYQSVSRDAEVRH
jgi:hypothetical protein